MKAAAPAVPRIYGTFYLLGEEYAIEMSDLQEVVPAPEELQQMPRSPRYLMGLYNLRGRVLPVISMSLLLETRTAPEDQQGAKRLAVLRRGSALVGLLFDEIGKLIRVLPQELLAVAQHGVSEDVPRMPVKQLICRDEGREVVQILDLGELLAIRNLPLIDAAAARSGDHRGLAFGERQLHRERLIAFVAGRCGLAIDMTSVEAVADVGRTQPAMFPSDLCDAMMTYQGRSIPVIKTSRLLQLEESGDCERVLVCRAGKGFVGFAVDQLGSIVAYTRAATCPIPLLQDHRADIFQGYFSDSQGRDHLVLNEEGFLRSPEVMRIANMHTSLSEEQGVRTTVAALVPQVNLLTFRLGKLFGLRLTDVVQVMAAPAELPRTPSTPAAVLGILNLRGTMVPVLDPRLLFEVEANRQEEAAKLLIFSHEERQIAMRVDSIEGILPVSVGGEDELPSIFFSAQQTKMKETFERGMKVLANGETCVVMILSVEQIVRRLAEAMAA